MRRRFNTRRVLDDADVPGCFIVAWILGVIAWLAFWIVVGYVALHFIAKWW